MTRVAGCTWGPGIHCDNNGWRASFTPLLPDEGRHRAGTFHLIRRCIERSGDLGVNPPLAVPGVLDGIDNAVTACIQGDKKGQSSAAKATILDQSAMARNKPTPLANRL